MGDKGERVDFSNSNLSKLDISRGEDVTELFVQDNVLQELDVTENLQLVTLDCSGNPLRYIKSRVPSAASRARGQAQRAAKQALLAARSAARAAEEAARIAEQAAYAMRSAAAGIGAGGADTDGAGVGAANAVKGADAGAGVGAAANASDSAAANAVGVANIGVAANAVPTADASYGAVANAVPTADGEAGEYELDELPIEITAVEEFIILEAGKGGSVGLKYSPEEGQTYFAYPDEGYRFNGWFDVLGDRLSIDDEWNESYGTKREMFALFAPL